MKFDRTSPVTNLVSDSYTYVKNKKYLDLFLENYIKLEIDNINVFIEPILLESITNRMKIHSYVKIDWIPIIQPEMHFNELHNRIYKENSEFDRNFVDENAYYFVDKGLKEFFFGDSNYIGAGAVIGGQGFKVYKRDGKLERLTHVGGVKIGSNCEIKAAYIDRATFEGTYTELVDNVFLDNGVHIAHNVLIESNTLIVANSVVGGSTKIGQDCWIGMGALIRENLEIGDNVFIGMGSVVTRDIGDNEQVAGNFAIQKEKYIEHMKNISKLRPQTVDLKQKKNRVSDERLNQLGINKDHLVRKNKDTLEIKKD